MISLEDSRRPNIARTLRYWAVYLLLSAAFNVAVLCAIFFNARIFGSPDAAAEQISQTTPVSIEALPKPVQPKPRPLPQPVRQPPPAAPARAAIHELARTERHAPPQPPAHRRPTISPISRDEAAFGREVAQLNERNQSIAIPTIDPGSRESSMKSYHPHFSSGSEASGNGLITPTRSWHDRGLDCYYGRYEYTYPNGSEERSGIAWPFCYDPASDPFHEPPHTIPFPLPMEGYVLPSGTQLPPIEKEVYEEWSSGR